MQVLFIDPNLSGIITYNIGLAYIVSAVEAHNHKIDFLDFTFKLNNWRDSLRERVKLCPPQVIGLSVTHFSLRVSIETSEFIRAVDPRIRIIWGGSFPTLFPEEAMSYPLVDAICIGEGEKALPEYLDKLETGKEPNVDGIWYKDKNRNVIRNRLRPFEEDLDSLPFPDWDLWDIERHLKKSIYFLPSSIKFLSSRGCPYSCSFCSNAAIRESVPGRYYRLRSPDNLIAEIKYNEQKYYAKGFGNIHFADDIFGLDKTWFMEFCGKFKKEGLHRKFSWDCATRADVVTPEWAKTAAETGCRWVWLGIESGDDYIREVVYRKDITIEDIINAAKNLEDHKISAVFSIIIGCPEDTRETINSTIDLIRRLNPTLVNIGFYQLYPKTYLSDNLPKTIKFKHIKLGYNFSTTRITTKELGFLELDMIMWKIRIIRVYRFFKVGLRMRQISFILDFLRYILPFSKTRSVSLFSPILPQDIELKTLFQYSIER